MRSLCVGTQTPRAQAATLRGMERPNEKRSIACRISRVLLAVLLLCAIRPAMADDDAVPAFKSIDSIEARVQGCVTCHGQSGAGTSDGYFPRIAGKPVTYLYNQLVAFRDGTRKYPPMNYLVAYLPDAYLREIAGYYAKQRPPFTAPAAANPDPVALARGAVIANVGDASRQIPACIACHGRELTGMEPGIPALAGLRPTYIAAQLTRWQVGDRHALEPDCMKRVASRLSQADIAAVAAWLSTQRPSKDASPESFDRVRMPLACGSQQ
jgi:cytochrome c553